MRRLSWLIAGINVLVFSVSARVQESPAKTPSAEVRDLIQKVTTRYHAVFSFHMIYRRRFGTPKKEDQNRADLTVFGSSWHEQPLSKEKSSQRFGILVHKNKKLDYRIDATKKPPAWVQVHLPERLQDYPGEPPYFAGTFWYEGECKYVEKYAGEGVLLGEKEIEGVRTKVLEWPLPDYHRLAELQNHVDVSVKGGECVFM